MLPTITKSVTSQSTTLDPPSPTQIPAVTEEPDAKLMDKIHDFKNKVDDRKKKRDNVKRGFKSMFENKWLALLEELFDKHFYTFFSITLLTFFIMLLLSYSN
jgi:hypothetical protein